ncbi:hypothetical protein LINPERPRIM_LOCUS30414 [Linum perenne]
MCTKPWSLSSPVNGLSRIEYNQEVRGWKGRHKSFSCTGASLLTLEL